MSSLNAHICNERHTEIRDGVQETFVTKMTIINNGTDTRVRLVHVPFLFP